MNKSTYIQQPASKLKICYRIRLGGICTFAQEYPTL